MWYNNAMRQELLDRKQAVTTKFDELTAKKKSLQEQISEVDTELVRLQGEYRAYELLESTTNNDSPVEGEVLDANTITVDEPQE